MQIHNVTRKTKLKTQAQVGRGGKRGKTSGRGTKGQKARSGHKIRPAFRDIIKKIPKLRGRGKNKNVSSSPKPSVVSVGRIAAVFTTAGAIITSRSLVEAKLIRPLSGKNPKVTVVSDGDINVALVFENVRVTAGARAKIEAAGGTIK